MRSRTAPGMPGRCTTCWIKEEVCICGAIEEVHTRFAISVLRHHKESFKTTNTARIAALALPALSILDYGGRGLEPDLTPLFQPGTFLLFPSSEPTTVPPLAVQRLVVLDGTWSQARGMLKKIAGLRGLPRISVAQTHHPALRLRAMPFAGGLSTLEAIAAAVELLDAPSKGQRLYALHDDFVARTLKARGRLKVALPG